MIPKLYVSSQFYRSCIKAGRWRYTTSRTHSGMSWDEMLTVPLYCADAAAGGAAELKQYVGADLIQPIISPPASAAATTGDPSPLCPVLAFKTLGAQTLFKLALSAAVLLSALAVLLLVRGYSVVWAAEPWTTAWMGGAYVTGVTLASLLSGLGVLGVGLLVLKVKWRGDARHCSTDGASGYCMEDSAGLQEPLMHPQQQQQQEEDGEEKAGGRGKAASHAAVWGYTPKLGHISEGAVGGIANGLQLRVAGHMPLEIQAGRPDVAGIIKGWLKEQEGFPGQVGEEEQDAETGQGTAPAAAAAAVGAGQANDQASGSGSSVAGSAVVREEREGVVAVGVYGMGPAGLVAATQMICDHINRGLCSPGLWLQYKQKTHEL